MRLCLINIETRQTVNDEISCTLCRNSCTSSTHPAHFVHELQDRAEEGSSTKLSSNFLTCSTCSRLQDSKSMFCRTTWIELPTEQWLKTLHITHNSNSQNKYYCGRFLVNLWECTVLSKCIPLSQSITLTKYSKTVGFYPPNQTIIKQRKIVKNSQISYSVERFDNYCRSFSTLRTP